MTERRCEGFIRCKNQKIADGFLEQLKSRDLKELDALGVVKECPSVDSSILLLLFLSGYTYS